MLARPSPVRPYQGLLLALLLGCAAEPGVSVSAEGLELAEDVAEDAAADTDAPGDTPPEPAAPPQAAVDVAGGNKAGPLGTRRLYFHGVMRSRETRNLESGRRLTAYTARPFVVKLGDALFEDGRWWFGDDDRLHQHNLWLARTTPALCASAAAQLGSEYGPPTRDRAQEKVWVGKKVMARWIQRDLDRGAVRCEVEWLDLAYFGG